MVSVLIGADPLVISAFVQAVQRGLEGRAAEPTVGVIRMPAGADRFFVAGAAAGTGEPRRAMR